jgi:hypothetical protein
MKAVTGEAKHQQQAVPGAVAQPGAPETRFEPLPASISPPPGLIPLPPPGPSDRVPGFADPGPGFADPGPGLPAPLPGIEEPLPTQAFLPGPAPARDDAFWLPTEEVARDAWPERRLRVGRPRGLMAAERPRTVRKPPPELRDPRRGLAALVLLALLATFFAWVTAEPIWLAVGRGVSGTATVTACTGSGVAQRCHGDFTAADGGFTTEAIRLLGVPAGSNADGSQLAARMVGPDSRSAYAGTGAVIHLRWALGLIFLLACGVGIVWATGALRLEDRRSRRRAAIAGLAAPLLLTIGFLAATF